LIEGATAGLIDLYFQDESGFAPTLPLGNTWAREGTRPLVRYEAPQGRRVNVSGAIAPFGPRPRLVYDSRVGKLDGAAFVQFIEQRVADLPAVRPANYQRERPCVVVVDNYAVHHGQVVRAAQPGWAEAGLVLFYLPPYSPELNAPIEALWRQVKYHELPRRSYTTAMDLKAAVDMLLHRRAGALAAHAAPALSFLMAA
jgi:putative transposase